MTADKLRGLLGVEESSTTQDTEDDPIAPTAPSVSGDDGVTTTAGGDSSMETAGSGGARVQEKTKLTPGRGGRKQFISYVAAGLDEEEQDPERPDPDGLKHEARMELEKEAIASILECEPDWQRTPMHNRGYDLYQVGGARFAGVKSRR